MVPQQHYRSYPDFDNQTPILYETALFENNFEEREKSMLHEHDEQYLKYGVKRNLVRRIRTEKGKYFLTSLPEFPNLCSVIL